MNEQHHLNDPNNQDANGQRPAAQLKTIMHIRPEPSPADSVPQREQADQLKTIMHIRPESSPADTAPKSADHLRTMPYIRPEQRNMAYAQRIEATHPAEESANPIPYPPSQIKQPQATSGLIIREILETLLLTLLIFWVVNAMTGRFRIEGTSMMPTMEPDQYVLINKLAYWLDEPERGDIIVLHYPRDPSRDFIKRVIALPGDHVRVQDREVFVNGVKLDEPYINAAPGYNDEWTVPPENVFVFGDNRNNSQDSHNFGGVPFDLIVGRGWAVYWPFNQMGVVPHNPHPDVPPAEEYTR